MFIAILFIMTELWIKTNNKPIRGNLIITCGKKTLGYYDYSMFSYSIENIEQSLR